MPGMLRTERKMRSLRREKILSLRWIGTVLLAVGVASLWFREELRDSVIDDTRFAREIAEAARQNGLDPMLVRAVVFQESRFDPFARGRAGEAGLMQILPSGAATEWARANGKPTPGVTELLNPETNLTVGCWYLACGMRRYAKYRQVCELALARYNAGESRADKWRPEHPDGDVIGRIRIASTKQYVTKIMQRYRAYQKEERRKR